MPTSKTIKVTAHAKVNLTLHVVGQRANGYHELHSLVCLTEFGDQIHLSPGAEFSFQVIGPYAAGIPVDESNLVVQAAKFMAQTHSKSLDCQIILEKNLPMASGIGGGSSDAAAVMRALSQYWSVPLPNVDELMALGADIPVCMNKGLTLMQGAGEDVTQLSTAPNWGLVLVNPSVGVSTPAVFNALDSKQNPPMQNVAENCVDIAWLGDQRNDLEPPAKAMVPEIATVVDAISEIPLCQVARMSGSGATCFGLFTDIRRANVAADHLQQAHPNWWVVATKMV
ncbi:MAG: 4-(cytidine 5'-diphospho)-2-C-methyl-D-erythritol kinase [Rhodobacteraceae bacterium]|nr:4-(cytidine 5'-diphospho)-2-C-methyl-D-erythritol kinase [Paracoccaceae bacterium]NDD33046.1 4-(cytidine 5'-diphospho)-2-C-methyl-D-erythritol kinase [Paracoccaceae bacterium]